MRYIVRFSITYRNGATRSKTRMVNAKSDQHAFQIIKDQQLQDYSIEQIELIKVEKMT